MEFVGVVAIAGRVEATSIAIIRATTITGLLPRFTISPP